MRSAEEMNETAPRSAETVGRPKVVVVMPAYNAARTLRMTYRELPQDTVDMVILVDDGSTDDTVAIARELNLKLFLHDRNYGYGANQKTCYAEALKAGADIVVMVHPDYQYDPRLLPEIVQPIQDGAADVVLGSRLKSGSALSGGMPWWKYLSNRFLTGVENRTFGLQLSEYHTGYRAYRREVLETVNYGLNADKFIFDQEIMAQVVEAGFRIAEVPVPTRYFAEASSASFLASSRYGVGILWLVLRYQLHRAGLWRQRQFQSLRHRYRQLPRRFGDAAVREVTPARDWSDPASQGLVEGYQTSHRYRITPEVYDNFLAAFGDTNALHVDDAFARDRGFPERVTHGVILVGFISHFVGVHFPGENTLLHALQTQFISPSHLGDEIEIEATVTQVAESVRVVTMDLVVNNLTRQRVAAKAKVQVGLL